MTTLVLITSVINTSSNRLSYSKTRSKFNAEERYIQTQKTIESVREKIPGCKIFLIETSELPDDYTDYFLANTDYYLNLCSDECIADTSGSSKALGEGTQTIHAIKYIMDNDIDYDNLIKISGRYYLSDAFDKTIFENNKIVVKTISNNNKRRRNNNNDNILTAMYKLPKLHVPQLRTFLLANINKMKQCIGYEILFGTFVNGFSKNTLDYVNTIGVCGLVSICASYYSG